MGAGAVRELAARHAIRPTKTLGQNFLIDPNMARAIAADAELAPGDHVVEVGAGLGSLTLPLTATGAAVVAIEFDRSIAPGLHEVVDAVGNVRVVHADAMKLDWREVLDGSAGDAWTMCANLPYNISVPLTLRTLEQVPAIVRWVLVVQREVGERLVAGAGDEGYGAVSVRRALRASGSLVRRVPSSVFWPRPKVDSIVVRLDRLSVPPVDVDEASLLRVVDEAFAQRRKTMRNALRRLGAEDATVDRVLAEAGVRSNARPQEVSLEGFATITRLLWDGHGEAAAQATDP